MCRVSRKAIISALVIGLKLCLCLLCLPWTSLWVYVTPGSYPPLLLIFRRWLRSRNVLKTMRDWISISGEGLVPHIPWFPQAAPAKAALDIHCLGHFIDCFSWSYLHPACISFTPHPLVQAFPALPFTSAGCSFLSESFPSFDNRLSCFYPVVSPSSLLPFPSLPRAANGCPGVVGFINFFSEKIPFSLISLVFWELVCSFSLIRCAQQLQFDCGKALVFVWRRQDRSNPPLPRLIWTAPLASSHYF